MESERRDCSAHDEGREYVVKRLAQKALLLGALEPCPETDHQLTPFLFPFSFSRSFFPLGFWGYGLALFQVDPLNSSVLERLMHG